MPLGLSIGSGSKYTAGTGISISASNEISTTALISPTTTRGDLIYRDATVDARLAVGGATTVLASNGTDPGWRELATTDLTSGTIADARMPDLTGDVTTTEGAVATTLGAAFVAQMQDFRLTLTTATSVTTGDVTGATTVYFTPHKGNRIALYNGTKWVPITSAEVSLELGTLTSGLPYDVFAYSNSGTLTLEFLAWTNGTTRATALVRQDGVWCETGALTRRYLGTFYTTSTTETEDSAAKRFLFNADNQVARRMHKTDATDSWAYTTATWRSANNSIANRVEWVDGLGTMTVDITVSGQAYTSTTTANLALGVGIDITNGASSQLYGGWALGGTATGLTSKYVGVPGVGVHFGQWVENPYTAAGTVTWYGETNGSGGVAGILGSIVN